MIAASGTVILTGSLFAHGGDAYIAYNPYGTNFVGGGGSGGAVRIVAKTLTGSGSIEANGGRGGSYNNNLYGGNGRIRLDVMENDFSGPKFGVVTQGFQPIIIP